MEVKVQEKLNEIIKPSESATNHINVLNFYADWAAPCNHLNEVRLYLQFCINFAQSN